jgi:hypothetical protein
VQGLEEGNWGRWFPLPKPCGGSAAATVPWMDTTSASAVELPWRVSIVAVACLDVCYSIMDSNTGDKPMSGSSEPLAIRRERRRPGDDQVGQVVGEEDELHEGARPTLRRASRRRTSPERPVSAQG